MKLSEIHALYFQGYLYKCQNGKWSILDEMGNNIEFREKEKVVELAAEYLPRAPLELQTGVSITMRTLCIIAKIELRLPGRLQIDNSKEV